jgi:hypothetical protein
MRYIKMIAIITALFLTACANIFSESHYPVTIKSNPTSAEFSITDSSGNLIHKGVTPETVVLDSSTSSFERAHYKIKTWKQGHEPVFNRIDAEIDEWYYANVLNIFGFFAFDPLSGAMYELPESSHAFLIEKDDPVIRYTPYCKGHCSTETKQEGIKTITTKVIPLSEKTTVERSEKINVIEEWGDIFNDGCNKETQPCD